MRIIFSLISILCILGSSGCQPQAVSDHNETVDILNFLSGKIAIDGVQLSDRYSIDHRKIAADFLLDKLKPITNTAYLHRYSEHGNNVVGLIEATESTDSYIIIGAHFYSVEHSPGANDNATGVALIYAVTQSIQQLDQRSHHVLAVFFDEEESGLKGSLAFATKMRDDGVNVHAVITVDQMGWDSDGDRGIELEMPDQTLLDTFKATAKNHDFNFPIQITDVTSTDHHAFRLLGFKAIGITEEYINGDTTPHYHKPTDSIETVNFEYLESTIQYVNKVLADLL